jgi:hypothetical protein
VVPPFHRQREYATNEISLRIDGAEVVVLLATFATLPFRDCNDWIRPDEVQLEFASGVFDTAYRATF